MGRYRGQIPRRQTQKLPTETAHRHQRQAPMGGMGRMGSYCQGKGASVRGDAACAWRRCRRVTNGSAPTALPNRPRIGRPPDESHDALPPLWP